MPTNLLSVAQAAEMLGLARRSVNDRIKAGTIAAEKIGTGRTSAYVITRAEVDRVKAGQPAEAAS